MMEKISQIKQWQQELNTEINIYAKKIKSMENELEDTDAEFIKKNIFSKLIGFKEYKKRKKVLQQRLYRTQYYFRNLNQDNDEITCLLSGVESLLNYFLFVIIKNKDKILSEEKYVKIKKEYQQMDNMLKLILDSKQEDPSKENLDLYRIYVLNRSKISKAFLSLNDGNMFFEQMSIKNALESPMLYDSQNYAFYQKNLHPVVLLCDSLKENWDYSKYRQAFYITRTFYQAQIEANQLLTNQEKKEEKDLQEDIFDLLKKQKIEIIDIDQDTLIHLKKDLLMQIRTQMLEKKFEDKQANIHLVLKINQHLKENNLN